ncbi:MULTISPECIES: 16S rRNA (guanine(966)-N(2))-methyltransferase RsmD [Gammaproteobacteria]|uniref:16S rRNA (guanine(966)-N(2))-methyltransferase RsmD n=1 Tax=Gammaproteobacteria TaxID=1236 RepID=UPI000DD0C3AC|nr:MULTISPECIES: 16S rRNA (guanine(966)-N(2))-methyltransferase RsmD [Gammaproteobacteria]RTE86519.1 16S rRNA (guanine(966)-N(2))-methyltransferase RsmD [Aliidiomarina sp. B3213]TCZ90926.1 16S rRNA (guanine(966)-N(2))-methyltransferase RsmD [Lysobacter sp. N42]
MNKRNSFKNNTSAAGTIRIIGGAWRGRKLPVLTAEGLRPTTDRLKETVFNWLQFELPGTHVLDAFAGTGSLGLEALSRGAASALFLEMNGVAAKQLELNLGQLKTAEGRVEQIDTLKFLQQPAKQQFDVVFLDPPFHKSLLMPALKSLIENGWLAEEAWIYVETEQQVDLKLMEGLELYREKKAGQSHARLFQWTQQHL